MPPRESLYPADWLRIAEKDLQRVTLLLESHDPGAAGFYLQQSVEKRLKAFLLFNGWRLEKIHDLESLLNSAIRYDASLEAYREGCQMITTFYSVERYPYIVEPGLTEDGVRESLTQVSGLIEKIRAALRHLLP